MSTPIDLDETPKKGERWVANLHGKTCRVMSDPVEGYVMARYKGAAPWLVHVSDWGKKFKRSQCDGPNQPKEPAP